MKQKSQTLENEKLVVKLIQDFQSTGSKAAERKIVELYQHLVGTIARKYSYRRGYDEDLVQVGLVGLLSAIRRYDPTVGKNFASYAIPTIKGEIKHYLRDKTWSVHVPRKVKELGPKIKNAIEELTVILNRSPQVSEIAEFLEECEEDILEALELGQGYRSLSIERTLSGDYKNNDVTILEVLGEDDKGYEKVNSRLVIESVLQVLTDREKKIIHYTYLNNLSQKDTGDLLGISQMHVSRIQRKAIKKLRKAIREGA
ncbi:RNA polymerase sigma factor SigB [Fredinandcohnia quinoae]|uniref:RNA polymerase sigma factor n=1 Tax=Fredinandcohnia quinoae TaxID=2918902 RepID=A0AAW5EC46_9BACI|nr:RNA polymerase sigma factor SigB [Fredinandcohnia sp. SECRCQ15]MCH1627250.1 RNA polymerase sigma factor SigB [Fredinandcohnia sp. SECRCQ15]